VEKPSAEGLMLSGANPSVCLMVGLLLVVVVFGGANLFNDWIEQEGMLLPPAFSVELNAESLTKGLEEEFWVVVVVGSYPP
jgi:hypothetical protein